MNEEEFDEEPLYDDEAYQDESVEDSDSSGDDSSSGDESTQAEQPKSFGQEEYERTKGNKNYYKDKQEELNTEKKDAKQNYNDAKNDAKNAKQEKKDAKKSGDKDAYKAKKKDAKEAKNKAKDAKAEAKAAKNKARRNKIDNAKRKAYEATHPAEVLKDRLKQKYDPRERIKERIRKQQEAIKKKAQEQIKKQAKKIKEQAKKATEKAAHATATAATAAAKKTVAAAKVVSEKAVKAANVILKLIKSHPGEALGIGIVFLFVGIISIAIYAVTSYLAGDSTSSGNGSNTRVMYNIPGITDDTSVSLTSADGTTVIEEMSIEKYVLGVTYYEMDGVDNAEAFKAHSLVVRSYILSGAYNPGTDATNGPVLDKSANTLKVKQNSNGRIYWDVEKDLYSSLNSSGVTVYSPEEYDTQKTLVKSAQTAEDIKKANLYMNSVMGTYALDSGGNAIRIEYDPNAIANLKSLAIAYAGSDNGSYTALVMKANPEVSSIGSGEVSMIYYGEVGEFSNWKQKKKLGAPWWDVRLGTSSGTEIDKIGCLVTSISMQIAYSGIETGNITNFNPGTFANALRSKGCLSAGGAINSYDCITSVIPGFVFVRKYALNGSDANRINDIRSYAERGYFVVLEVRKAFGGQHWVALDVQNTAASNWSELYIWDPASTKVRMNEGFNYKPGTMVVYKKAE